LVSAAESRKARSKGNKKAIFFIAAFDVLPGLSATKKAGAKLRRLSGESGLFVLVAVFFGVMVVVVLGMGMLALTGLGGGYHRRRTCDGDDCEQKENFFHDLVVFGCDSPINSSGD
jgi:hypothetical protein